MTESAYFDYHNGRLTAKPNMKPVNDVPESLGVAGSLTVASSIYGLTQADWKNIPVPKRGQGKDFDFKIAATISHFVVIESKGSVVADNTLSSAVKQQKSSIVKKKKNAKFKTKYAGDVCFGLISAIDPNHDLKVWITDPDIPELSWSPRKVKLLKRLTYYYHLLRTISPRAHLTITLGNRIKMLFNAEDIQQFDNLPLLGIGEKEIEITDSFVKSKTHSEDGNMLGKIFINSDDLFFVGLERSLLTILSQMSFSEILMYKEAPKTSVEKFGLVCKKDSKESQFLTDRFRHYGNKVISNEVIPFVENSAGLIYSRISQE